MHRGPVFYPIDALTKNVEGTVTAQVKLDGRGNVVDATITSGPDELRKAVLQAVLNWHFTSDSANTTRQVTVAFAAPDSAQVRAPIVMAPPPDLRLSDPPSTKIVKIDGPAELVARLPVQVGDTMTQQQNADMTKIVREYDEHFRIVRMNTPAGLTLQIRAPEQPLAPPPVMAQALAPPAPDFPVKSIRVGANVQQANLVSQEKPVYPPLAKAARVQGTVRFDATIGPDGTVQNLHVIEGPPLLVQAAMEAVQKWVYKPTLLNGNPVSVTTTIDINFTLSDVAN
jgi:TonB family protein